MRVLCRKCGGSGHMYEMQNELGERIFITLSNMERYQHKGYREVCQTQCSMCDGTGVDGVI